MTSCNGHFLSKSVADSGFMVASSELGDFAIENLQSPQADLAWRGDSASAVTIQGNLKAAETLDTLALCLHNMTSAATITIDLYDSRVNPALLSITETVGGSGTIPAYKNHVMSFAETAGVQEFDITITDAGNPDGYIQIRRLKVGLLTIPDTGFDFGYTFGFVSGEDFRAGEITWMWNSEDELNAMNELVRDYGVDPDKYARTRAGELLGFPDDILWLGYPESTNDTTKNQHTALVALVGADIPYRPNAAQGVFVARFEEVYYEPIVELPTAFITTWHTTAAAETITLPATGTNSFVVDWGDGSSELVTTASPSHEYADAGDHVVSVEGICRKWYQNNTGDKLKIVELSQWGAVGFTELNSAFYGCTNLDITATDTLDVSIIEDFSYQFANCTSVTSFQFSNWDVSSGRDFTRQFNSCSSATSFPFSAWDVSSGETFNYQFAFCSAVTSFQFSAWDVSSGRDFTRQFASCSSATSFPFSAWDVSSGETFNYQFAYCNSATSFPFSAWDVSSGETFNYQFAYCSSATSFPFSTWVIASAIDMDSMFLNSSLSDSEYDDILLGWSAQVPLAADFNMHFGTAKYSAGAAATARAALVSDGITITDGGPA